ncbi:Aste57867_19848 [Aphanomyces stellatus]|uniref:Aste57867_19848 protein n=1 Tax=Aphanomyces stellatus TaxID=120398 RepID=A0A485LFG3_9STRA|nr:hypothetical protein As57867_019783 [Aphanomyces stellatus]VFT96546.1 Aste57867_19848 [Aphanomyces stellatus]
MPVESVEAAARRQTYRRQDREALANLRQHVQVLTRRVQQEKQAQQQKQKLLFLLPWRDVVGALADVRAATERQNHSLKVQLATYRALACQLMTRVGHSIPMDALPPSTRSWQDQHLPLDTKTRFKAMDWIHRRLVVNVDKMVAAANLPYTMEDVLRVYVEPRGETSCARHSATQRVVAAPLEAVMQGILWLEADELDVQLGTTLARSPAIAYVRHPSKYLDNTTDSTYTSNMLTCHTTTATRFVSCRTSITDDAKYPNEAAFVHQTEWMVAEALGPNMTLVRSGRVIDGLRWTQTREYIPMPELVPVGSGENPLQAYERRYYEVQAAAFAHQKELVHSFLAELAESRNINDDGTATVGKLDRSKFLVWLTKDRPCGHDERVANPIN